MIRRVLPVWVVALVAAVALLAGCTPAQGDGEDEMGPIYRGPLPPVAVTPAPATDPACRAGDPLAGVYHPQRLQVVQRCAAVTGRVTRVRHEQDGDFHVDVVLDAPFANLVNSRNRSEQEGALVVEIIPSDQAGVAKPKTGEHVRVVGPYVLDRDHGWMEIHPVWAIKPAG